MEFKDKLKGWVKTIEDTDFECIKYILSICVLNKQHAENLMNNIFNPYMIAIIVLMLDKMIEVYVTSPMGNVILCCMLTVFLIKMLLFLKNEFYKDAVMQDFYQLLYDELTSEEPR